MYILSYLFFTFFLLNIIILASNVLIFGNTLAISRTLQLMWFSLSWGLFSFAIFKEWNVGFIFLLALSSVYFSFFVYKDWIFLYIENLWSIDLKSSYLKKIVYYYNPRIYLVLLSGSSFLLLYFLTNLVESHFFILALSFFVGYYLGLYLLQNKITQFNALIQGIMSNNWTGLSNCKVVDKYVAVLCCRAAGLGSYPALSSWWKQLELEAPALEKNKLILIRNFYENRQQFFEDILVKENFNVFDLNDKIKILGVSSSTLFEILHSKLSTQQKQVEEIVHLNVSFLISKNKWVQAEQEVKNLPEGELKEDFWEEIFENKLMQIKMFDYTNYQINDFEISDDDYVRPSRLDRSFIKKYKMELFSLFDNRCCFNGSREEIEIDHFFIPKSKGGSFVMKHKNGFWVVNAIILNKKNNIIKNNSQIDKFFDIEQLAVINLKLKELNLKVNYEYSLLD